MSVSTHRND